MYESYISIDKVQLML